jgi:hypothetical protein
MAKHHSPLSPAPPTTSQAAPHALVDLPAHLPTGSAEFLAYWQTVLESMLHRPPSAQQAGSI